MKIKSIVPKKSLGQNFLIDRNIARNTVSLLDIQKGDNVIEIGPGTGALTSIILEHDCNLTAIEIDSRAITELKSQFPFSKYPTFNLVNQDFRDYKFDLNSYNYKVIGNIPYYLSSEIFFKLFDSSSNIDLAVMTVQKELAQRLIAKPRTKDYGILTLAMVANGSCNIEFDVSPQCFYPAPNVWSSVIKMDFRSPQLVVKNKKFLSEIIRKAFNQRRKMLGNTLKNSFNSIDSTLLSPEDREKLSTYSKMRPEELSLLDFEYLCSIFDL